MPASLLSNICFFLAWPIFCIAGVQDSHSEQGNASPRICVDKGCQGVGLDLRLASAAGRLKGLLSATAIGQKFQQARELKEVAASQLKRSVVDHCWSKSESHLYYKVYTEQPSRVFVEILQQYEGMHRHCARPDIVSASFTQNATQEGSPSPACQYVIHKGAGGFGNQMQGLLSTFLFALLTNRTLIVGGDGDASLLCEPFEGSSWVLPTAEERMVLSELEQASTDTATLQEQALQGKSVSPRAALSLKFDAGERDEAFFCEEGQTALQSVPWLQVHHARYFAPSFMAVPAFRAQLEHWFPDRMVFTQLARRLLHPKNVLWERITRVYRAHLSHAAQRVGIQVRTFANVDAWANQRVLACAWNVSRALPPPILPAAWERLLEEQARQSSPLLALARAVEHPSPRLVKVFVASIHGEHVSFLRQMYEQGAAADGSTVAFHAQPAVGMERWHLEQHALALVDAWLLSFCQQLLTSSQSTLGHLAAGLAGVRPFVLNIAQHEYGWRKDFPEAVWSKNGKPVCTLAPSADPCGQPKRTLTCSAAAAPMERPPEVQQCTADLSINWQIQSAEVAATGRTAELH